MGGSKGGGSRGKKSGGGGYHPTEVTDSWKTKSGLPVEVVAKLTTTRTVNADGVKIDVPDVRYTVDVKVDGKSQGSNVRELTTKEKATGFPPEYTHIVGRLALTTEQAKRIEAVGDKIRQHPTWKQHEATIAKNREAAAAVDRNERIVRDAMRGKFKQR